MMNPFPYFGLTAILNYRAILRVFRVPPENDPLFKGNTFKFGQKMPDWVYDKARGIQGGLPFSL
jgi:hypothetical protein